MTITNVTLDSFKKQLSELVEKAMDSCGTEDLQNCLLAAAVSVARDMTLYQFSQMDPPEGEPPDIDDLPLPDEEKLVEDLKERIGDAFSDANEFIIKQDDL